MAQTPSKLPFSAKVLPAAAAVAVVLLIVALRCSKSEDVGSGPNVGAVSITTQATPSDGINSVTYRVTGNDIEAMTGSNAMTNGSASFMVKEIPAGNDYVVMLTATGNGGSTRCIQKTIFKVTADKITALQVALPCTNTRSFRTLPNGEAADSGIEEVAVAPGCKSCEEENIKNGKCEPDSGCDGLVGVDRDLCLDLLACARKTGCWMKRPLDCLCGNVGGVECAKGGAMGNCRREMQAATKTTDPIKNGTLMFDPTYPSGRAMRLVACDFDNCQATCGPQK